MLSILLNAQKIIKELFFTHQSYQHKVLSNNQSHGQLSPIFYFVIMRIQIRAIVSIWLLCPLNLLLSKTTPTYFSHVTHAFEETRPLAL